MAFYVQIKHQDDNLREINTHSAVKYFIPSNAIRAHAFHSHSMHASSFKKRARTGTLQALGLLLPRERREQAGVDKAKGLLIIHSS